MFKNYLKFPFYLQTNLYRTKNMYFNIPHVNGTLIDKITLMKSEY